jgi:hypothetical protein
MAHDHRTVTPAEGPHWTDENGELDTPYLSCRGCPWVRVHDFHYMYCRDLGDKSKPDFTSVYDGGMLRLWNWPHPDKNCKFSARALLPAATDSLAIVPNSQAKTEVER